MEVESRMKTGQFDDQNPARALILLEYGKTMHN